MPACSSVVFGISTAISTFGALMANLIAGLVIKEAALADWRKLFILFCIIYIIGGLAFVFLGSAKPQPWAEHKKHDDKTTVVADKPGDNEMTPMKSVE